MSSVGENVVRIRKRIGLSQKELAARLGIAQSSTWSVEKGTKDKQAVELRTLFRLAKALDCSIEDLVVGVDEDYDRLRRDLPWQGSGSASAPHQGRADVPASAQTRVRELAGEKKYLEDGVAKIEAITRQLVDIVAEYKSGKARKGKSETRKVHRNVGR